MKKSFRYVFLIAIVLSIGLGYLLGFFLHGRLMDFRIRRTLFSLSDMNVQLDSLYDFYSSKTVHFFDTLSQKKHNLLVFWSPTCAFSKDFFSHQLNEKIVGIYCIPLTDDLDYLKYYIEKRNIKLPQLMVRDSGMIVPIEASSIVATPTFVVVDKNGINLKQYVGINDLDNMITFLYQLN